MTSGAGVTAGPHDARIEDARVHVARGYLITTAWFVTMYVQKIV